jgi:ribosomal protein S18 acetylase RimI-like enzyme
MTEVRLRPATVDDVDWLYTLHRAALGRYVAETWGWDEDAQAQFFRRQFDPTRRQVIVCDGCDAGFLDVERRDDCVALVNIELAPDWQGRGVGSQIIRGLLEEACWWGVPVRLQVLRVNDRARSLYERLGFVVIGETATHFQMQSMVE